MERKSRIDRAHSLQLSTERKIGQMQDFVARCVYLSLSSASALCAYLSSFLHILSLNVSLHNCVSMPLSISLYRMGAKASKASQAKDRLGKIAKLEQDMRDNAIVDPLKKKRLALHFSVSPNCGEFPLKLVNATVGCVEICAHILLFLHVYHLFLFFFFLNISNCC